MLATNHNANFDIINRLCLIRSENIGPQTFKRLINIYGNAIMALEQLSNLSQKGGAKRKIRICEQSKAIEEIEKIEDYGAQLVFWDDPIYPQNLNLISDAPPVLTVKGNLKLLNAKNIVAVVGSRAASTNGLYITREIVQGLSSENITIVSGLAKGIDAYAHQHSKNGSSIGVIASGINIIYPSENKNLFAKVAENGVIITEYPFNSEPISRNFPKRNRIISGLSKAIIVIEASLKSGSLITAQYAIKYNRKLFAVPGSTLDSKYSGCNHLIKKGNATLITGYEDVIDFLKNDTSYLSDSNQVILNLPEYKPDEKELDKYRSVLHNTLSFSPTNVEDIILTTGIPYSALNILLLEMEIAGCLERTYGNKVTRIA